MATGKIMNPQLKKRGLPLQLAPEAFQAELSGWLSFGILPDDELLVAILRNDLQGAIALTAGTASWRLVRATLIWLWNYAPANAWGSAERVHVWREYGTCWQ